MRSVRSSFASSTLGEGRSDTRRRVARGALDSLDIEDATIDRVLDTFGRLRILTFDREPATREPTVEIAHEALLDAWPRLRRWIDEAREDLRQERVLIRVAGEWLAAGQDPSFLLRGARLEQAEAWLQKTDLALGHDVRRYVVASIAERTRERDADEQRRVRETEIERRSARRLRALVAVFAAAALVAGSLTLVATDQGKRAERSAAVSTVRELAAASVSNLEGDPELAVLLAVEAVQRSRTGTGAVAPEAAEALHRAIAASRIVATIPTARGPIATSVDDRVAGQDAASPGRVAIFDLAGTPVRAFDAHDGEITDMAFGPTGASLITAGSDGWLRAWDPDDGALLWSQHGQGPAMAVTLDARGSLVAARWHQAGRILVLDARTGRVVRTISGLNPSDGPFAVGCAQSRWVANRDGHGTPERRRDRADRRTHRPRPWRRIPSAAVCRDQRRTLMEPGRPVSLGLLVRVGNLDRRPPAYGRTRRPRGKLELEPRWKQVGHGIRGDR